MPHTPTVSRRLRCVQPGNSERSGRILTWETISEELQVGQEPLTDTAGASGPEIALQPPAGPGNTQGYLQTNRAHFLFPLSAPPKTYSLGNIPKCFTINTSTQEFQARCLVLGSPFRIQAQRGGLSQVVLCGGKTLTLTCKRRAVITSLGCCELWCSLPHQLRGGTLLHASGSQSLHSQSISFQQTPGDQASRVPANPGVQQRLAPILSLHTGPAACMSALTSQRRGSL